MTKRTAIVGLFCVVLLCAVAESGTYSGLVLTDLEGNQVRVDSLLATGPVVLNFWATWCKPCRLEMPHLQKVASQLTDNGVTFAAISIDAPSRMKDIKAYIKKHEVTLPVYHDTKWELAKLFKVLGIPTTVLLDREAFHGALLNLVLNAEQEIPEGGQLVIRTYPTAEGVALDLIDTGCGMDEETCSKVFDAFFSTKSNGSGLGLPTTRKIIEAHGGTITVQSELGRGTQFTIKLPTPARLADQG